VGRYYDPATGQFLNVDPMVNETGLAYSYTGDDPLNDTDPSGLDIFITVSASTARVIGHFLNGTQTSLQVLDSYLGVVAAAAVWALDYVNRLTGQSNPGDALLTQATIADKAAANSGRPQKSQAVVVIDIQTISVFGFDTKIPTGSYLATGTSRKTRTAADISGCGNGEDYV
jgi:uncharacterized protein RhaS with RHS repeats